MGTSAIYRALADTSEREIDKEFHETVLKFLESYKSEEDLDTEFYRTVLGIEDMAVSAADPENSGSFVEALEKAKSDINSTVAQNQTALDNFAITLGEFLTSLGSTEFEDPIYGGEPQSRSLGQRLNVAYENDIPDTLEDVKNDYLGVSRGVYKTTAEWTDAAAAGAQRAYKRGPMSLFDELASAEDPVTGQTIPGSQRLNDFYTRDIKPALVKLEKDYLEASRGVYKTTAGWAGAAAAGVQRAYERGPASLLDELSSAEDPATNRTIPGSQRLGNLYRGGVEWTQQQYSDTVAPAAATLYGQAANATAAAYEGGKEWAASVQTAASEYFPEISLENTNPFTLLRQELEKRETQLEIQRRSAQALDFTLDAAAKAKEAYEQAGSAGLDAMTGGLWSKHLARVGADTANADK